MKGNKTASERLNAKTLDQMFVNMVEQGYECPPFVSNAILETAKSVFVQDQSNPNVMNVGQLRVLGITVSEPAGKPLSECEMKTAVVTLDAGKEDEEIRSKYGLAALRQARLARVTHEAWDQGVTLTQEDVASKLLNCSVRTVRRDIKALAKRGVIVPTRGQQKDIGPGVSHKVETVRLFIERKTYTEIERTLKHSLTAIKRYILTFSRVAYLTEKGYTTKEIAFLVQISERLTRDYQALYRKYKEDPAYKDRLDEILALNSADRVVSKGGATN
uniref:DUF1670 domain-containing protein n=1 Tax=Candidatus Methanophagaceae archaeon ANME-1 ERB6 TaxID=2759912 RepID=A0A7G9YXL2_9EURY|nr:hypothetical protein KDAIOKAM_00015 [Methanosarcinales archaeon ANME-1 ERB6]